MSGTAIAIYFYKSLDVKSYLTAKVTLYVVVSFDFITETCDFILGKILCTGIGIDTGLSKDILGALKSNTVNVGKRDLYTLVIGNINTSYTSHFDIYSFLNLVV